jgi:8-hydroxy-5-deazaflavin:NADPH oxidoreductase
MHIGIIGAGFIARAVASIATRHGHDVTVSNSRGPDTLFSLVGTIGCKAGTPERAAAFGDIVVVAIPLRAYQSVPAAPLDGKVVLDANNYYPERDGHIAEVDRNEISTSELLATHVPKSRIVNQLAVSDLIAGQLVGDNHPRHIPRALEQLTEKPLSRHRVALRLHQDVEHVAVLVDRAPHM